jgi:DHA2 family multidrug resistance protein
MPQSKRENERSFDFLGFGLLSITVAALQLALDRGQSLNWLASTEIIAELMISGLCFYLFLVHTFTTTNPFLEPKLFRDRNFVAGLVFNFFASSTLMGTMALMPSFLQNLLGIPVLTAGMLMAPRGIGTLLAMMIIPKLADIVDPRWLLLIGIVVTGLSMGQMAHLTLDVDSNTIMHLGFIQGVGLGFTMIPISILIFSTLDRRYRTEGTAMYNLLRNLGGSLFISLMITKLAQNTQTYHAHLTESVTAFGDALPAMWDWRSSAGAMALNGEITRQASGIAYFNDFMIMQWLALVTIPLLLLFKKAPKLNESTDKEQAIHAD